MSFGYYNKCLAAQIIKPDLFQDSVNGLVASIQINFNSIILKKLKWYYLDFKKIKLDFSLVLTVLTWSRIDILYIHRINFHLF